MKMYKIYINVPSTHTDKLIEAMAEAGGGIIQNYTHCAFIVTLRKTITFGGGWSKEFK